MKGDRKKLLKLSEGITELVHEYIVSDEDDKILDLQKLERVLSIMTDISMHCLLTKLSEENKSEDAESEFIKYYLESSKSFLIDVSEACKNE
jgi:CRISPR/Cas system CMR subunit Cmr4 (Cas7 group RAMP superfamily)